MRDKVAEHVLVANVDLILVTAAAGRDWNARRLERYLALVADSGAEGLVVITKADLCPEPESLAASTRAIAGPMSVVMTSALTGLGMEALSRALPAGKTAILIGSSGSGKSSLLNALAGKELSRVQEVRAADEKGRHTTSTSSLYVLPGRALVIDSPGLREVQLWTEAEDVDAVFPEIAELGALCRFMDCAHGSEPGCAVREAAASGRLDASRLEAWRKLRLELELLGRRSGPRSLKILGHFEAEEGRRLKAYLRSEPRQPRSGSLD